MAVIIARSILKKERKQSQMADSDREVIIRAFEEGIGVSIKGESLPKGSRVLKVYASTVKGARRIVYLVDVSSGDEFFLFYRSKNDSIGENISIKNLAFKNTLLNYLELLDADIDRGEVDVYETKT